MDILPRMLFFYKFFEVSWKIFDIIFSKNDIH